MRRNQDPFAKFRGDMENAQRRYDEALRIGAVANSEGTWKK